MCTWEEVGGVTFSRSMKGTHTMLNYLKSRSFLMLGLGLTSGLAVGVGMAIGVFVATNQQTAGSSLFPETALHAVATARSESSSMAVATGPIDEDTEGLFTLDFQTGELMCFVMYPKGAGQRRIGGFFKANVIKDLGFEKTKKPNYLLVTGVTSFVGRTGTTRPGLSVAYVVDPNTGNFVAYGVPWDQTAAARMAPQMGALVKLDAQGIRKKP